MKIKPEHCTFIVQRREGKIEQHEFSTDGSINRAKTGTIVRQRLKLRKGDDIVDIYDWMTKEWIRRVCKWVK